MDELSLRILSYLAENPGANDTLEGIAQWWLLEREIRDQLTAVERAVAELTAEGWLVARHRAGLPPQYRLNLSRAGAIRSLLEGAP